MVSEPPTGVNANPISPAGTARLDEVVIGEGVGLIATSTGIFDAARVVARRVSDGELPVAALLASAQYPTVPFPGPRKTTWPAIVLSMLGGSVQPDPSY